VSIENTCFEPTTLSTLLSLSLNELQKELHSLDTFNTVNTLI
jgi:hypothetical protein